MRNLAADQPARVRLRGPADLAAAVPHLVGFYPRESLVVVSLRGPRLRIGLTMRFDLVPADHDADFAEHLAARLEHDGAAEAFVACCTDEGGEAPDLPRRRLIDCVEGAVQRRNMRLKEALLIRDERFWSYLCDVAECCPPTGTPVPTDGAAVDIAAAHAMTGRGLLPDRAALVASIRPVRFLARKAMEQALDRVDPQVADRMLAGAIEDVRAETVEVFGQLLDRYDDVSIAQVNDDEAARVIVGLHDVHARDAILNRCLEADDEQTLALLTELARRAIPPDDAPVCTALAWAAYASGSGALANVALERALASDPAYSLARLLSDALNGQVPPSLLRQAWLTASVQTAPRAKRTGGRG